MLHRNCTIRGLKIFKKFSKIADYKFQIRSFDSSTFDKKGRAEENRYYIREQNEQIIKLKKQLERMENNQTKIMNSLAEATDNIKKLRIAADAGKNKPKKT